MRGNYNVAQKCFNGNQLLSAMGCSSQTNLKKGITKVKSKEPINYVAKSRLRTIQNWKIQARVIN